MNSSLEMRFDMVSNNKHVNLDYGRKMCLLTNTICLTVSGGGV